MRRLFVSSAIALVLQIVLILGGFPTFSALLFRYLVGPLDQARGLKALALIATNIFILTVVVHGVRALFLRSKKQESTS